MTATLRKALDAHDVSWLPEWPNHPWQCRCGDAFDSVTAWRDHREAAVRAALTPASATVAEGLASGAPSLHNPEPRGIIRSAKPVQGR